MKTVKRERISDLYEDFEPEIRVWPYVALGFLIPLVPILLSLAFGGTFTWQSGLRYCVAVLPLVFSSLVMKDGEKAWLMLLSGGAYLFSILILWIERSLTQASVLPLGIPFALALSPMVLSLLSYSFFQKRKRGKWAGVLALSLLLSIALAILSGYGDSGFSIFRALYPILLVALGLSIFLVTRRSDSTPWYLNVILFLLLLSSSLFHSGILEIVETRSAENISMVSLVLGVFVHDFEFWYTLSFLFVFASLASKSSYRTVVVEEEEKDEEKSEEGSEVFSVPPQSSPLPRDSRYSYPPSSSRFSPEEKKEEPVVRKEEYREERPRERDVRTPRQPRYEEERRDEGYDDKWYEFIQGGVREEERPRPREERRREYPEYRDERRYRDDERDYRRYDDRDYRDRRRDDYRDVRDDRDYYRRRDYDERRDYYDDRRDRPRIRRDDYDDRPYRDRRDWDE